MATRTDEGLLSEAPCIGCVVPAMLVGYAVLAALAPVLRVLFGWRVWQ